MAATGLQYLEVEPEEKLAFIEENELEIIKKKTNNKRRIYKVKDMNVMNVED